MLNINKDVGLEIVQGLAPAAILITGMWHFFRDELINIIVPSFLKFGLGVVFFLIIREVIDNERQPEVESD